MFWKKKDPSPLDEIVEIALSDLKHHETGSSGFATRLDKVERLYKLKAMEDPKPEAVSRDTMASIGANLLGILMIIRHERVNVIASKALGFVVKTKVT